MNRDTPEKIDQDCNVCGAPVEVGTASSRCSNRKCPTRDGHGIHSSPLGTDSTDGDIAEYLVSERARKMSIDTKDMDVDAEHLAAATLTSDARPYDIGFDILREAAEKHLGNRPTTFLAGHEFGWNCGQCSEINFHELDGRVENGTELQCDGCGASYEVRIA
jgi:hypothetical protein